MSSHTYLISDTRERYIHGFIDTLFDKATDIQHTISQINTGDYLICNKVDGEEPEILACIERKTLKDFAASFKDGRYENRLKMLDLRDKTGCQLYFFVEGPAFPKSTWKVNRIPYGNILSAMTNMMIRDGIHIVQTENEMGTAQRLLDFTRSFENVDIPYLFKVNRKQSLLTDTENHFPQIKPDDEITKNQENITDICGGKEQYIPVIMNGTVEKDISQIACEMWAKLPGISITTAKILLEWFSVYDLISGETSICTINEIKTAGGRKLTKKNKSSIIALHKNFRNEEIKILSGVPNISKAMATQLLYNLSLTEFIKNDIDEMSDILIQQKSRNVRLGKTRAERIIKLMNYKKQESYDKKM